MPSATGTGDDLTVRKRQTPPFWWPDVNAMLQLFLAFSVVVMVGYILYQLLEGRVTLEQAQRDLLMILFGIILGCFKDVYGYTFGSSAGQKRQGEVITKSLEDKDKIIAEGVSNAAALAATSAPTADALRAAAVVAPIAAAAAAPPAADVAAPPAAREAVADALAEQGIPPKPKETP